MSQADLAQLTAQRAQDEFNILKRYSVSGRQIIDIFKVRAKNKPKDIYS